MKTAISALVFAITGISLSIVCACEPPPGPNQESSPKNGLLDARSYGINRWREFTNSVTYLDLVRMVEHEKLIKELQISEDNAKRLAEFRHQQRQNRPQSPDAKDKRAPDAKDKRGTHSVRDPAAGIEAMKAANGKAKQLLHDVLQEERFDRLIGLYAQLHGYSSIVRHKEVAQRVGISEADLAKLQERQADLAEVAFEDIRELVRMGAGREEIAAEFKEMRDAQRKLVERSLTQEQKQAFEKLQGEKFEFPLESLDEARGSFRKRPSGIEGDRHKGPPGDRHKGPPHPKK